MAPAARLALALLGVAGAAALVASARPRASGPSQAAIDQAVAEVDARLREATAGATTRAQTLADLPRLGVAVATDAATVRDLTGEELAFRLKPGETIEIAQALRGQPATSLLRLPAGAEVAARLDHPGVHVMAVPGGARVAAVVRFEARERRDELDGVVAVTWPVALDAVTARLGPLGGGARLLTASGATDLGAGVSDDGPTVDVPLGGGRGSGVILRVAAATRSGWRTGPLAGGLALAGLTIGAALAWPRRRPLPSVAALEPPPAVRRRASPTDLARIGDYAVLGRLGSGGMAEVYLARIEREAGFERLVALKVMHDELVSNPKFVSHFLDEARLASKLVHPNIVAITDLGRAGDEYVIAMEYVDGADLEALARGAERRGAAIPVAVALAILRRVCDGLQFAHAAVDGDGVPLDLVHRDVKGANVFVARNGSVKVGDFGIAKIAGSMRSARTELGEVKGTAAYMAPEHRLGQEVDARADLYAVGAIGYELLTGQEINLDLARIAHLGREGWPHLAPPSQRRAELPPELDAVVFKAMAFDRADRYPSAEALEQALATIVERHGLRADDKAIARWVEGELAGIPRRGAATEAPAST